MMTWKYNEMHVKLAIFLDLSCRTSDLAVKQMVVLHK